MHSVWRAESHLQESAPSFKHAGPRDRTQTISLCSKHLHLLNCLVVHNQILKPEVFIFNFPHALHLGESQTFHAWKLLPRGQGISWVWFGHVCVSDCHPLHRICLMDLLGGGDSGICFSYSTILRTVKDCLRLWHTIILFNILTKFPYKNIVTNFTSST